MPYLLNQSLIAFLFSLQIDSDLLSQFVNKNTDFFVQELGVLYSYFYEKCVIFRP